MSNPVRLSEEEMRRIEAEELAALKAVQEREAQAQRRMAAHAYREEVRAALRPRPLWWPLRWLLPFLPVIAVALWLALRPAPLTVQDNTWGGISDSALMNRCETAVTARLQLQPDGLAFPNLQDSAGQFTASPDGKRWDGWAVRPQNTAKTIDFSCTYTAADQSLQVELIQEDAP